MNPIRTQLIKIGNSQGIRIPKLMIDQTGLGSDIEISAQGNKLVIRSASKPRSGWDEQFRLLAENNDDKMLDDPVPTQWDESEWQW